jgi:hypothetical protein
MARFARDCLDKFKETGRKLETTLGPDTLEMGLRVGMHSGKLKTTRYHQRISKYRGSHTPTFRLILRKTNTGPVTAGVLRGDKARFQLFGDTVNTASRMESTGIKNRIQCSTETAELLLASGKSQWITPRDETVHAKGKGELQTYWVQVKNANGSTSIATTTAAAGAGATGAGDARRHMMTKTTSTSSPSEACSSEVGREELLLEEEATMD